MKRPSCHLCEIKSRAAGTLTPEELGYLDLNCTEVDFKPGEVIIRQGQFSSHIAFMKSGLAKIHMIGPTGRDQVLKIVTPRTYIGLQTIISDKIHRYSATVLEPARVCFIDIHSFKELISRNPKFSYEIIVYLCHDEISYYERFVNLAQKQVNGRLADAILFFANDVYKSDQFRLSLSRGDLAALIGVTRESVSRALREIANSGVLLLSGKEINILDKNRLLMISKTG